MSNRNRLNNLALTQPLPRMLRSITHPEPSISCRNADVLERKGINNWLGYQGLLLVTRRWYIRADGNHTPYRMAVARVRPTDRHPWSVGDGPGVSVYQILSPSALQISASGIPRRCRQIRETGCNPNMHFFTQGEASKCFKSAFYTIAAKLTSFRYGWVRSPSWDPCHMIPSTFGKVRFLLLTDTKVADIPQNIASITNPLVLLASSHWAIPQALFATTTDLLPNKPQPCKSHIGCP